MNDLFNQSILDGLSDSNGLNIFQDIKDNIAIYSKDEIFDKCISIVDAKNLNFNELLSISFIFKIIGKDKLALVFYNKLQDLAVNTQDKNLSTYILNTKFDLFIDNWKNYFLATSASNINIFFLMDINIDSLLNNKFEFNLQCIHCSYSFKVNYYSGYISNGKCLCPHCLNEQALPLDKLRISLRSIILKLKQNFKNSEEYGLFLARMAILLQPVLPMIFVNFRAERIGHYMLNTLIFLCKLKKMNISDAFLFGVPPDPATCSNNYLTKLWRQTFTIIPAATIAFNILNRDGKFQHLTMDLRSDAIFDDFYGPLTGKALPFIKFNKREYAEGQDWLREHGVSGSNNYACFFVRDSLYMNKKFPGTNWHYHDFRDSKIKNYVSAMNWLVREKNFPVFRMGTDAAHPMEGHVDGVFDLARSRERTDFLDLYVTLNCKLYIGSASGPNVFPDFMGIPVLMTDVVYPSALMLADNFYYIFKKFYCNKTNKLLSLKEIIDRGLLRLYDTKQFEDANISLIDNSEEEILASTQEMFERTSGTWVISEDEVKFQKRYRQIFKDFAPGVEINASIGFRYLQLNQYLLD